MENLYNNDIRKLYPTYIGFIKMKNGEDMVCDPDLCVSIVDTLNTKGLIRSDLYQRTIHAFDIEYIKKMKTKDEQRILIDKLILLKKDLSDTPILSFNQSIEGLKKSKPLPSLQ